MKIKSILMFMLVGSAIIFSSPALNQRVHQFVEDTSQIAADSKIDLGFDPQEVRFWIFILSILGVTMLIIYIVMHEFYQLASSVTGMKPQQSFFTPT